MARSEERNVIHVFAGRGLDDILQAFGTNGIFLVGQLQQFDLVLIDSCFGPFAFNAASLNNGSLGINVPSFNFDAWCRFARIAGAIGGRHLSRLSGQQGEVVVLPEHGQDFIFDLTVTTDSVARCLVHFQVYRKGQG